MMQRIVEIALNWMKLCPEEKKPEFTQKLDKLKSLAGMPRRLAS